MYGRATGFGEYVESMPWAGAYQDGSLGADELVGVGEYVESMPWAGAYQDGSLGDDDTGIPAVNTMEILNTPIIAAYKMIKASPVPSLNGLEIIGGTVGLGILIGAAVLNGFLSYQAGKAMAPSGSSKSTWGWIAVPTGMITGAAGLGIMGLVANSKGK